MTSDLIPGGDGGLLSHVPQRSWPQRKRSGDSPLFGGTYTYWSIPNPLVGNATKIPKFVVGAPITPILARPRCDVEAPVT